MRVCHHRDITSNRKTWKNPYDPYDPYEEMSCGSLTPSPQNGAGISDGMW